MSSLTVEPQIKERDAGFFVKMGWVMTIVGAGGFFLWASLAPLDQGIPVQGTVVVSGKRKAVQTFSPGVVSRILVKEGELVKQGQPLFRLDQTQNQADVQSLQAQYRMAWASVARWQSERDNLSSITFPAELSANPDPALMLVLEGQRQLFSSRRDAFAREQAGIRASIEGANSQLSGMRRARSDLTAQAQSLRAQLSNLQPLADNGYIPRNRLMDYQRQLSQVQQDLAQNAGESGRIEQGIVESRLKLQQHSEEYQKEVRSQLADAQLRSLTLEQQLTSAGFNLQHSEINAPADGIAVNLSVHTEGDVVPARPPGFCTGCPERPIFAATKLVENELGRHHIASDIGCHLFSIMPPFELGATTCRGAGSARRAIRARKLN